MQKSLPELKALVQQHHTFIPIIKSEIANTIVGQTHVINRAIIALLTEGHILLEGVPGLAKTLLCNTIAKVIDSQFQRIQFTPDLLPADLIGTLAYRQDTASFYVKKGPIFANLILADEVNRAPAKVQSALLEAMQEQQVTIGDTTYQLPRPFLVMATQNPIDQEGTYKLPEAQVDRFMMKILLDYPSPDEEKIILETMSTKNTPKTQTKTSTATLLAAQNCVDELYIDERIKQYIVNIVYATRTPQNYNMEDLQHLIDFGASPRASIMLAKASKANAFLNARAYILPEDVKEIVHDVLRHRITLSYEAEADNISTDTIIDNILDNIEVP